MTEMFCINSIQLLVIHGAFEPQHYGEVNAEFSFKCVIFSLHFLAPLIFFIPSLSKWNEGRNAHSDLSVIYLKCQR